VSTILAAISITLSVASLIAVVILGRALKAAMSTSLPPGDSYGVPEELLELTGQRVPAFEGIDKDGREFVLEDAFAERPGFLGLFDAHCEPCHQRAPRLTTLAEHGATVAVITGTGPGRDDLVRQLVGVDRIILDSDADRLADAWGIRIRPTFLRTDGRTVLGVGLAAEDIAAEDMASSPAVP
jgi:hypothetical protein